MTNKEQEKKDRQTSREAAQELRAELHEEEIGATEAFYNFFDAAAAASAHTEKNDLGRRGYVIDPSTGCPVRGDEFRHEEP
jgi:hypothetical protein